MAQKSLPRPWSSLKVGDECCICPNQTRKNNASDAWHYSIHVMEWNGLLGRSSCSSPSTKEHHAFDLATKLNLSVSQSFLSGHFASQILLQDVQTLSSCNHPNLCLKNSECATSAFALKGRAIILQFSVMVTEAEIENGVALRRKKV